MTYFVPVEEIKFCHKEFFGGNNLYQDIVLCDFDGTISEKDVTDTLLEHFGNEKCEQLEQQWLNGIIGSRECMQLQIANMTARLSELNEVLAQIKIDPTFVDFVDFAQRQNLTVHIVSDGLDYAIQSILKRYKLDFLPVYANKLLYDGQQNWQLQFPYASSDCVKASGNCKCQHRRQLSDYRKVFYVGDGTSDFCVADKVDLVFAKDKLIEYCQQHQLPFQPIGAFSDVLALLPNLINAESVYS